ncbi:MAG TPA: metal-dependent hydrolase [Saprospiraceae bacterium]|nr:metal-dependent hydrolase [Saprospiraceae bacterium]
MPTIIGHCFFGMSLASLKPVGLDVSKAIGLSILCSCIPDIDGIGFFAGIPYHSIWGHRGITHSILFAMLWSYLLSQYFLKDESRELKVQWFFHFFWCTISHSLLDSMTDGGLGVGFFLPFIDERYFIANFIPVSPMSIGFFSSIPGILFLLEELTILGLISIPILFMGWLKQNFLNI